MTRSFWARPQPFEVRVVEKPGHAYRTHIEEWEPADILDFAFQVLTLDVPEAPLAIRVLNQDGVCVELRVVEAGS